MFFDPVFIESEVLVGFHIHKMIVIAFMVGILQFSFFDFNNLEIIRITQGYVEGLAAAQVSYPRHRRGAPVRLFYMRAIDNDK